VQSGEEREVTMQHRAWMREQLGDREGVAAVQDQGVGSSRGRGGGAAITLLG
jgi:hypothetical protein